MLNLTIDQLKKAIERERGLVVQYTLSRCPGLAKHYQKQVERYEAQLLALETKQSA